MSESSILKYVALQTQTHAAHTDIKTEIVLEQSRAMDNKLVHQIWLMIHQVQ